MNEIILEILKRKIVANEITVEEIKNEEYKAAIMEWEAANN